jgi:hypothetical protein
MLTLATSASAFSVGRLQLLGPWVHAAECGFGPNFGIGIGGIGAIGFGPNFGIGIGIGAIGFGFEFEFGFVLRHKVGFG